MGIIVDLLPGVVVRTEPKHVKLLARCLGLHTWFKKQINKQKNNNEKTTVTTTTNKEKVGWRPGPLRAWVLDLRSSTITGGDFSSRKRNNCFAKCLTLGSFESVRSYVHFKCAFNVFVGY